MSRGEVDERTRYEYAKWEIIDRAAGLAVALNLPEEELPALEAEHGLNPGFLGRLLSREDGALRASYAAARLIESGEAAKWQAYRLLGKLLSRMEAMIDGGEVSPSAAPKFADTLVKVINANTAPDGPPKRHPNGLINPWLIRTEKGAYGT